MKPRNFTHGQSLAELALMLPLLAIMLMGLLEFGMLLYAHIQVSNSVREAGRAAALYRSTRYQGASVTSNGTVNQTCTSGITGWSLQQTVEQAVVYRSLNAQNCPDPNGSIVSTSLGLLPTAPSPDMWMVTITPAQSGDASPTAGTKATITLRYPYKLFLLSQFVPMLSDPIWIEKSAEFEFQQ